MVLSASASASASVLTMASMSMASESRVCGCVDGCGLLSVGKEDEWDEPMASKKDKTLELVVGSDGIDDDDDDDDDDDNKVRSRLPVYATEDSTR